MSVQGGNSDDSSTALERLDRQLDAMREDIGTLVETVGNFSGGLDELGRRLVPTRADEANAERWAARLSGLETRLAMLESAVKAEVDRLRSACGVIDMVSDEFRSTIGSAQALINASRVVTQQVETIESFLGGDSRPLAELAAEMRDLRTSVDSVAGPIEARVEAVAASMEQRVENSLAALQPLAADLQQRLSSVTDALEARVEARLGALADDVRDVSAVVIALRDAPNPAHLVEPLALRLGTMHGAVADLAASVHDLHQSAPDIPAALAEVATHIVDQLRPLAGQLDALATKLDETRTGAEGQQAALVGALDPILTAVGTIGQRQEGLGTDVARNVDAAFGRHIERLDGSLRAHATGVAGAAREAIGELSRVLETRDQQLDARLVAADEGHARATSELAAAQAAATERLDAITRGSATETLQRTQQMLEQLQAGITHALADQGAPPDLAAALTPVQDRLQMLEGAISTLGSSDLAVTLAPLVDQLAIVTDRVGGMGEQLGDVAMVVQTVRASLAEPDDRAQERVAAVADSLDRVTTELATLGTTNRDGLETMRAQIEDLSDTALPELLAAFAELVTGIRDALPETRDSGDLVASLSASISEPIAQLSHNIETIARRSDSLNEDQHALRAALEEAVSTALASIDTRTAAIEEAIRQAGDRPEPPDLAGQLDQARTDQLAFLGALEHRLDPLEVAIRQAPVADGLEAGLADHLAQVRAETARLLEAVDARTAALEASLRQTASVDAETTLAERQAFADGLRQSADRLEAAVREVGEANTMGVANLESAVREMITPADALRSELADHLATLRAEQRSFADAIGMRAAAIESVVRENVGAEPAAGVHEVVGELRAVVESLEASRHETAEADRRALAAIQTDAIGGLRDELVTQLEAMRTDQGETVRGEAGRLAAAIDELRVRAEALETTVVDRDREAPEPVVALRADLAAYLDEVRVGTQTFVASLDRLDNRTAELEAAVRTAATSDARAPLADPTDAIRAELATHLDMMRIETQDLAAIVDARSDQLAAAVREAATPDPGAVRAEHLDAIRTEQQALLDVITERTDSIEAALRQAPAPDLGESVRAALADHLATVRTETQQLADLVDARTAQLQQQLHDVTSRDPGADRSALEEVVDRARRDIAAAVAELHAGRETGIDTIGSQVAALGQVVDAAADRDSAAVSALGGRLAELAATIERLAVGHASSTAIADRLAGDLTAGLADVAHAVVDLGTDASARRSEVADDLAGRVDSLRAEVGSALAAVASVTGIGDTIGERLDQIDLALVDMTGDRSTADLAAQLSDGIEGVRQSVDATIAALAPLARLGPALEALGTRVDSAREQLDSSIKSDLDRVSARLGGLDSIASALDGVGGLLATVSDQVSSGVAGPLSDMSEEVRQLASLDAAFRSAVAELGGLTSSIAAVGDDVGAVASTTAAALVPHLDAGLVPLTELTNRVAELEQAVAGSDHTDASRSEIEEIVNRATNWLGQQMGQLHSDLLQATDSLAESLAGAPAAPSANADGLLEATSATSATAATAAAEAKATRETVSASLAAITALVEGAPGPGEEVTPVIDRAVAALSERIESMRAALTPAPSATNQVEAAVDLAFTQLSAQLEQIRIEVRRAVHDAGAARESADQSAERVLSRLDVDANRVLDTVSGGDQQLRDGIRRLDVAIVDVRRDLDQLNRIVEAIEGLRVQANSAPAAGAVDRMGTTLADVQRELQFTRDDVAAMGRTLSGMRSAISQGDAADSGAGAALIASAAAAMARLEGRLDSEFDNIGRQMEALGTLVQHAIEAIGATSRDTGGQAVAERLRTTAAGVLDALRASGRQRAARRSSATGPPRGLDRGD